MAELSFFTDILPFLCRSNKSAAIVYLMYSKFQDDKGTAQITYHEMNEHLGLATETVNNAIVLLKKLNLIEEVEDKSAGKRYKLLPISPLSEELRQELMKEYFIDEYNTSSVLKVKYTQDTVPPDFQQLLNKKVLKQAYKALGSWNGKELCKHFKIDFHTFKLLHERGTANSYKERLKKLMLEVEAECAPKKKLKEKEITPEAKELTNYFYDMLSERDAKPIGNWYLKNCNVAVGLLSKGLTLEEGKAMIDWGFANDWWQDKMSDLKVLDSIGTRYKLDKVSAEKKECRITRGTELPPEVKEELRSITKLSICTYEDAYLLKQSVLDGESKKDILTVVGILENYGIVPPGSRNLSFG